MSELDRRMGTSAASPIQGHTLLKVTKPEAHYLITFDDGSILGEANASLELALTNIAEQGYSLDFDVFCPTRSIRETISRATKEKDAIVRVQISVYGPRTIARAIGKELSQHKIYFQRPDYVRDGVDYDNPHVLKLLDHRQSLPNAVIVAEDKTTEKAVDDTLKSTITGIYASLSRDKNLRGLEGDERLKTTLLP
jgi:SWI/SNF-related matrix-associated actin-dependent regulator of chromatin subfamily A3